MQMCFDIIIDDGNVRSSLTMIWEASVPLKVKVFVWTMAHRKLNTNDTIQKRRPSGSLYPY